MQFVIWAVDGNVTYEHGREIWCQICLLQCDFWPLVWLLEAPLMTNICLSTDPRDCWPGRERWQSPVTMVHPEDFRPHKTDVAKR